VYDVPFGRRKRFGGGLPGVVNDPIELQPAASAPAYSVRQARNPGQIQLRLRIIF